MIITMKMITMMITIIMILIIVIIMMIIIMIIVMIITIISDITMMNNNNDKFNVCEFLDVYWLARPAHKREDLSLKP